MLRFPMIHPPLPRLPGTNAPSPPLRSRFFVAPRTVSHFGPHCLQSFTHSSALTRQGGGIPSLLTPAPCPSPSSRPQGGICFFLTPPPLSSLFATLTESSILHSPQPLCLPLLRKLPGCQIFQAKQKPFLLSYFTPQIPVFRYVFRVISAKSASPTLPILERPRTLSRHSVQIFGRMGLGANRFRPRGARVIHRHIFHNESLLPVEKVRLSPGQAGLISGWGLFTTLRISGGEAFAYERHWRRLEKDAAIVRLPMPYTAAKVRVHLHEVIRANKVSEGCARIYLVYN